MSFLLGSTPIGEYYLVMTVLTFILFGADKRNARMRRGRIPKRQLIMLCFLGGAFGGFMGMILFNHKVRHGRFLFLVPFSLLLHLVIFAKIS